MAFSLSLKSHEKNMVGFILFHGIFMGFLFARVFSWAMKRWILRGFSCSFLSQLFLPTFFGKCWRTLLELNSKGPYPSREREIEFRRRLLRPPQNAKLGIFTLWSCKKGQRNAKKLFFIWRSRCCPRRWILKFLFFLVTFLTAVSLSA